MLVSKIKKSVYSMLLGGIIISVATLLLVSLICAMITYLTSDPLSVLGTMTLVSILLSAAISGIIQTRMFGTEGVKIATLTSLFIALVMMLIGLISNHGTLPTSGVMNYICYLLTAIFFSVVGRRHEGVRKHRGHRR